MPADFFLTSVLVLLERADSELDTAVLEGPGSLGKAKGQADAPAGRQHGEAHSNGHTGRDA